MNKLYSPLLFLSLFFLSNTTYFADNVHLELIRAVENGDEKLCKLIIDKIEDPKKRIGLINKKNFRGYTASHLAVQHGNLKIFKYFVAEGASLEEKDSDGNTPLHIAARNGHLKIVEHLLGEGADPALINRKTGKSPLHIAIIFNNFDIVKYLLKKGVDPTLRNSKTGDTPLHIAARWGHGKKFLEIFKFNKDVKKDMQNMKKMKNIKNKDGERASFLLEIWKKMSYKQI